MGKRVVDNSARDVSQSRPWKAECSKRVSELVGGVCDAWEHSGVRSVRGQVPSDFCCTFSSMHYRGTLERAPKRLPGKVQQICREPNRSSSHSERGCLSEVSVPQACLSSLSCLVTIRRPFEKVDSNVHHGLHVSDMKMGHVDHVHGPPLRPDSEQGLSTRMLVYASGTIIGLETPLEARVLHEAL